MNYLENYSLLFVDSLFANTVFYGNTEIALDVMVSFGGYNNLKMLLCALLGYSFSVILNYWFGRVLFKIYNSSIDNKTAAHNYKSLQEGSRKYGWIILFLNVIPAIGPFIPVLASFLEFGIKRTLLFTLISRILYYIWVIYQF